MKSTKPCLQAKYLNAKPEEEIPLQKGLELTFLGRSFINELLLLEGLCFIKDC